MRHMQHVVFSIVGKDLRRRNTKVIWKLRTDEVDGSVFEVHVDSKGHGGNCCNEGLGMFDYGGFSAVVETLDEICGAARELVD